MYTVKVGLTDNEMKFLSQPPKLWNGNKERVRLDFEGPGIEKDANFAVRFSDGTEVAAPYGKCFVPGNLFNDYEFGFQGVTPPSVKRTNLLYSNTVTTTEYGDMGFYYYEDLNSNLDEYSLTDGNTYLVVFDGKEYLCEAQSMNVGGTWHFLGNMYIRFKDGDPNGYVQFESNDEPFCFYYRYNCGLDTREDGEHTVEVYEVEVTDETVTNTLTVELKPGEKGLYTLVEGGELTKKLAEKVLPNAGGSGGGADWNAAEGEPGYIANKPFGVSELTWKSVLFEGTVTTADSGSGADKVFDSAITFSSSNSYAIVVDGVTYSYSSAVSGYTAGPYSGVGNASLFDSSKPDTGETFFCYTMWSQTHFRTVEPGAYEVKIGQAATAVSTIDPKCLPYAVVTTYDWSQDDFAQLYAKIDAELQDAYKSATFACPMIVYQDKFFSLARVSGGSFEFSSFPTVHNYTDGIEFHPVIEVENLLLSQDGSILHYEGSSAATFTEF